jgi:hypothetical protein
VKSVEFCYWLQGLFEVGEPETLNAKQVDLIKRHLNMVFVHEIDATYPKEHQDALNAAHAGETPKLNIGGPVMRC